jgi:hypothetical protein
MGSLDLEELGTSRLQLCKRDEVVRLEQYPLSLYSVVEKPQFFKLQRPSH